MLRRRACGFPWGRITLPIDRSPAVTPTLPAPEHREGWNRTVPAGIHHSGPGTTCLAIRYISQGSRCAIIREGSCHEESIDRRICAARFPDCGVQHGANHGTKTVKPRLPGRNAGDELPAVRRMLEEPQAEHEPDGDRYGEAGRGAGAEGCGGLFRLEGDVGTAHGIPVGVQPG